MKTKKMIIFILSAIKKVQNTENNRQKEPAPKKNRPPRENVININYFFTTSFLTTVSFGVVIRSI